MRGRRPALGLIPALLVLLLGAGQALATTAANVPCQASSPPPGPCILNTTLNVTTNSTLDFGARGLVLTQNGVLDVQGGTMFIIAGSLTLQPKAVIQSAEGVVDITTTGAIQVQANADGSGRSRIDVSGNSGGDLTMLAGGAVTIAGQLLADASAVQGFGGSVDVTGAGVTIAESAKLSVMGGSAGFGGDLSVSASTGNTSISGTLEASATGSDGGSISIDADDSIITTGTAVIDAHSGAGGSSDEIDFTAFTGGVTLDGLVNLSAAGSLDLGGGAGGDVTIDAIGPVTVDATIDVSGAGTDGLGGGVGIDTEGNITLRGSINASAPGNGGFAGLVDITTTDGMVDIQDDIEALGLGAGGDISVFSFNDIRVASHLTADGPSGGVTLEGCAVNVTATARLSSLGTSGANKVQASGLMTIAGRLQATLSNRLEYLDPTKLPQVTGIVTPSPVIAQNVNLIPCGGPPPTTSTTSSSTTSTTSLPPTTVPTTTSSTTTTIPVPVTTSTTLVATTSTTATTNTIATTSSTTVTTATTASTSTTAAATTSSSTTTTVTATSSTSSTTAVSTTSTTATSTTVPSSTTAPTSTSTATTTSSTSTTIVPATTTTGAPATTTTTTLPEPGCVPADCNDHDLCTADSCDSQVGCVHVPLTGFDAATCRLDTLSNTIAVTPSANVGSALLQRRFQARLAKARHAIDVARRRTGRDQTEKLNRAVKLLTSFIGAIERHEERGKIPPAVAQQLIALAQSTIAAILPLP